MARSIRPNMYCRLAKPSDKFYLHWKTDLVEETHGPVDEVAFRGYPNSALVVAIDDESETVVGSIEFGFADEERSWIYIVFIQVRKDRRNKGVAKRMINWVIEYVKAKAPGALGVWMRVDWENEAAMKSYEGVKFRNIGAVDLGLSDYCLSLNSEAAKTDSTAVGSVDQEDIPYLASEDVKGFFENFKKLGHDTKCLG
ncbi:hypothetical protein FOL47_002227, partial [Perkinsus chesapeaki]